MNDEKGKGEAVLVASKNGRDKHRRCRTCVMEKYTPGTEKR